MKRPPAPLPLLLLLPLLLPGYEKEPADVMRGSPLLGPAPLVPAALTMNHPASRYAAAVAAAAAAAPAPSRHELVSQS